MRIGIDAHVLGKGLGGVERFLRHVVEELPRVAPQHEYVIFMNRQAVRDGLLQAAANVKIVPLAVSNPLIERSLLLPWLIRRHRLDALMVQRLAPWFCGRCKLVLTVHDITPLKFPREYRGLTNRLVQLLTGDSVRRADLIFTPTQTIADEVRSYFGVKDTPIRPFYNGVDVQSFSRAPGEMQPAQLIEKQGICRPYIFVSGAIEARKNLETIYRAVGALAPDHPVDLVLAGSIRDQAYADRLANLAQTLGIESRVRRLGFVEEDLLVALYQQALAYTTASRDEGFNIPPLEAMACGIPVICSDIPVHRELFEGSALFFPVDSAEALANCIRQVITAPESLKHLRENGNALVARLNWRATGERVAAGFARLIEK